MKKRIGIDARLYSQTGVGRYIRNLLENLSTLSTDNEYVVFVNDEDWKDIQYLKMAFIFKKINVRWHSIQEQLEMPLLLWKERLDLLHVPYFNVPLLCPVPFIVTIHDLTILTHSTGRASTLPGPLYSLKHFVYKRVLSHAVHNACHIIVPSYTVKDSIKIFFPTSRVPISVTYEGVKPYITSTIAPITTPYFLYVGNAYPHKNIEYLLSVFKQYRGDTQLVLVGEEDFFYKRLKKEIQDKRVIVYGKATDEELAALYSNAKALVFPSLSEGFGLPLVEAMTYGCPILASDITVFREICQDAARYFDPTNEQSLLTMLENFDYSQSDNSVLVAKGKQMAKQYSWEKMAKQTQQIYEDCIRLR